jgi:hypothetical protein
MSVIEQNIKLTERVLELEADNAQLEVYLSDERDKVRGLEAELRKARMLIDGIIKTHREMGHDIIADGIISRSMEFGITLPTPIEKESE